MAYTKIHPIESTLKKAIDYITNPNKTEEQKHCDGYACTPAFAAAQFELTRERANNNGNSNQKILGYHLIQSFRLDEATPEKATEIGKQLADELLKGQYEYVISTHVDRENIHNHIIINAINFENNKTFSTEHDRFNSPAWKQIREISDNLCKEHGLSVIQVPERGKGKSRYEWEQNKSGNSWKAKLRETIDNCIMTSDSFEDFLKKMQESGLQHFKESRGGTSE